MVRSRRGWLALLLGTRRGRARRPGPGERAPARSEQAKGFEAVGTDRRRLSLCCAHGAPAADGLACEGALPGVSGCGCGYPESAWTWWDQPYRAEDPVPCGDGALVVPVPARPDLAADLIGRAQAARERRRADFLSRYGQSAHVLVNEANALALRRIVSVHGWPGSRLVGVRGAEAALSVALGVDRSFFLRTLLRMLDTAVASGDAPRVHQALVYDRMCVLEGRPQRYGTQFRSGRGGVREVWPVAEPELLDIRRADVGLPPAARARGAVGPECGERALA